MSYLGYAAWAFAAGALIPLMAILNGGLARAAGHPAVAAATLFAVGFVFCVSVALLTGVRDIGPLLSAPPHLFGGGIIVGFYILSITILAPRFGVGNAILFVMVAQIFTSAAIDHFWIARCLCAANFRPPIRGDRIAAFRAGARAGGVGEINGSR